MALEANIFVARTAEVKAFSTPVIVTIDVVTFVFGTLFLGDNLLATITLAHIHDLIVMILIGFKLGNKDHQDVL